MFKKFLSVLLSLSMALTLLSGLALAEESGVADGVDETNCSTVASLAAAQAKNPFLDVAGDDYFMDAVLWAVEKGITSGTSTTTFSPKASCTRAQAVTFLYRAAGSIEVDTMYTGFDDVARDVYYADAVIWAAEEGITSGTSATTFSPNEPCTRAQIVTFLWRYLGK